MNFEEIYNIINTNKESTVVIDFDHIVTTADSETSIGVYSKLFNQSYKKRINKINNLVDRCQSRFFLRVLWFFKIILLKRYNAKKYINKVIKYFKIKSEFIKLFNYCTKNNIKVIICSSGYKPLIFEILRQNKIDKIEVIANEGLFKIITPLNKNKFISSNIKNLILLSNNINDINIYKNKKISIGVCNNLYDYNKLTAVFDYVILDKITVYKTYNTSKTKIGICLYNNKKCFFKCYDDNELNNYKLLKDYYKVSKFAIIYENYIIYEYIEDFKNNTLNDYLYGKSKKHNFDVISSQYNKSINNTLKIKNENDCKSKKYFIDRVQKIKEYINILDYNNLILNGKNYNIKNILIDITKIIESNKKLYAFISQGDPTDTNITTTGYFTDFENGGYNTLISEFAIIFVSLYSHGRYFYPKYNKKAYVINKTIINKYDDYKIDIDYQLDNKDIYINNIDIKLPSKNKKMILEFIDIYLSNPNYSMYEKDFNLIKYYVCMRLLTPLNINFFDEEDKITILTLLIYIYTNVDNLITLKELINGGKNGII